jgi:hypothetical protein
LRGSCERASTDAPYIATGFGGAPIGLRDHRRAVDLVPPASARRAPSTSNGSGLTADRSKRQAARWARQASPCSAAWPARRRVARVPARTAGGRAHPGQAQRLNLLRPRPNPTIVRGDHTPANGFGLPGASP